MYTPGNSIIVNICMRWPALAVVGAVCAIGLQFVPKSQPVPPPPPAVVQPVDGSEGANSVQPVEISATKEATPDPVPPLPKKKKKHG